MSWFERFLGKRVTINGCKGVLYQGVLIACLKGRIFLKDAYVCRDKKRVKFPLLSIETRRLSCLYAKEGDEIITLDLRAIGAG